MPNDLTYMDFWSKVHALRRITGDGTEYWTARDLQSILGYDRWERFRDALTRAIQACETTGRDPRHHFRGTAKMITAGKGAQRSAEDWFLSRYAAYLVAMNGDSRKPEISHAQTYFAVQARRQELLDQDVARDRDAGEEKRVMLRERVREANKALNSVAHDAGVRRFGLFHDAGYRGLYGMGLSVIKSKKGLSKKADLLDRAGRAELAANEFRVTQTEEKIARENEVGEQAAIDTHRQVGQQVRATIKRIGGTMPEDLRVEAPIKEIEARVRRRAQLNHLKSARPAIEAPRSPRKQTRTPHP